MARPRTKTATPALPFAPTINPQEELIRALQDLVAAWVAAGYPDVSPLTLTLLTHWFGEPHLRPDGSFFLWYPHQRRAVETAVYLSAVWAARPVPDYAAL